MTELRTTRPAAAHPPRAAKYPRALVVCLTAALAGVSGCGGERTGEPTAANPDPAPYRPLLEPLPPPAAEQIRYKAETRTLSFPDLPRSGQWMVKLSGHMGGEPAPGADIVVPTGADPNNTYVYYRRPGGQVSGSVSLSQIQAAARELDSQIR